jgi:Tol biopolymer transport system component
MQRVYVCLLLWLAITFALIGCFRQPAPARPTNPDEAIFSDADVDKARIETNRSQKLIPQDFGEVSEATEIEALPDNEANGDFETTAVLPGVEGFVYFIEHDPSLANPWRVFRFDQGANTRTAIYSGKRELQAVGGSSDGTIILLSMRQTVDSASDFEIFRFQVTPKIVQQLTDNAVDDTHVSLSASGLVAAWQSPNGSGVSTLNLHSYPDVTSSTGTLLTLSNAQPQVQPSLSGNGNFLVFIRELADGKDRVMRYDVAANAYLTIVTTAVSLEHPSVSDDGNKILWLQHNANGDAARLKNLMGATVQTVVNNANGIEHPFLTSNGIYLTYGLQRNGAWTVYTKNLSTATATRGTNPLSPKNHRGMVWMVLPPPPVTIEVEQPLTSTDFNYTSSTGETVTIPGIPSGGGLSAQAVTISVGAGVDDDLPLSTIDGINWVSKAINMKFEGEPDWLDDKQQIILRGPATFGSNAPQLISIVVVTNRHKTKREVLYAPTELANSTYTIKIKVSDTEIIDSIIDGNFYGSGTAKNDNVRDGPSKHQVLSLW